MTSWIFLLLAKIRLDIITSIQISFKFDPVLSCRIVAALLIIRYWSPEGMISYDSICHPKPMSETSSSFCSGTNCKPRGYWVLAARRYKPHLWTPPCFCRMLVHFHSFTAVKVSSWSAESILFFPLARLQNESVGTVLVQQHIYGNEEMCWMNVCMIKLSLKNQKFSLGVVLLVQTVFIYI